MGKCIRCRRTGVFLKMNTAGLCQICHEDLICQLFKILQIKDSIDVINESNKYSIVNNRVEYVIDILDKLYIDKDYLDDYFINFIGSNYANVMEAFLSIKKDLNVVASCFENKNSYIDNVKRNFKLVKNTIVMIENGEIFDEQKYRENNVYKLYNQKKYAEAVTAFKEIIDSIKDNQVYALNTYFLQQYLVYSLWELRLDSKRMSELEFECREHIKMFTKIAYLHYETMVPSYYYLIKVLSQQNRIEEALEICQQAIELIDDYADKNVYMLTLDKLKNKLKLPEALPFEDNDQ